MCLALWETFCQTSILTLWTSRPLMFSGGQIFCSSWSNISLLNIRSSSTEVCCKKGALRNFTKFTGKRLYQSLIFNTAAALRPETLLKKRLWHRFFPVNFAKFLRIPSRTEHLRWLLLNLLNCNSVTLLFQNEIKYQW